MEKRPSIGLCMITKDEEKSLGRCIESVRGLISEIVVADTGSADGTVALARSLGARVYDYPWDDSFARARNFAMSKATSDWLLLLDADEALDEASVPLIRDFVASTAYDGAHLRMKNYTGRFFDSDSYSLHSAMRLLRNTGEYYFYGDIHEQIISSGSKELSGRFTLLDAYVHHYGYLDEVVLEKQKRRRNIPILEKQLAENPSEPFTHFNMGNEYLSMQDYKTALSYYERAMGLIENWRIAFIPHLFFRMINCCEHLGNNKKALQTADRALGHYPSCTDFQFLRGSILYKCKRYTLAADSFEACLKMGTPPVALEFFPGCGGFRPALQLGELYFELEDFQRALRYFDLALSHKQNLYTLLYRVGAALNRIYEDKDQVQSKLFSYFSSPRYGPNALVGADVLVTEGLYPQALAALEDLTDMEGRETEACYVRGRALFYLGHFDQALDLLTRVCREPEPPTRVLRGIRPMSALLCLTLGLILEDPAVLDRALADIETFGTESEHAAAALMANLRLGQHQEDPGFPEEGRRELEVFIQILTFLLKARQFELFEQMLRALNYVDSKTVLMGLARLYEESGASQLAVEYALRSIRELDYIDQTGAGILFRRLV